MNKRIYIIFSLVLILILTGCSCGNKKKLDVTECTSEIDQSASGYVTNTTYKIYSQKDVVKKTEVIQEIKSDNNTILKYFEEQLNNTYRKQNDEYSGSEYDIKLEDKKLILKATTDYSKMNMEKYLDENSAMKSYTNDNKELTKDGIINMYKSTGAQCK